jgi:perosamine synthetase
VRINLAEMYVDDDIKHAVLSVLESGTYVKGEQNAQFEKEFARFAETDYAVSVNSGTSALLLALACLQLGKGDEVLIPSHTFIATANAVVLAGGTPVFADIDPATYTLDPEDLQAKVTDNTKAIVPVHLYGHPCDMDPIVACAKEHDLVVIEDACQAHGAEYKGRRCGSMGDMAAFSFFPSKNMTVAGDGGMVTTNREEYAGLIAALRDAGREEGEKYFHRYVGYNMRLGEIQAAIGRVQLRHVAAWNERRRLHADLYRDLLRDTEGVTLPVEREWGRHVYHQYVIRTPERDVLREQLAMQGIASGIHYPIPVHLQPAIREITGEVSLPETEAAAEDILSLPVHPWLSEDDIREIATIIQESRR